MRDTPIVIHSDKAKMNTFPRLYDFSPSLETFSFNLAQFDNFGLKIKKIIPRDNIPHAIAKTSEDR